jgi:hypothetical protein
MHAANSHLKFLRGQGLQDSQISSITPEQWQATGVHPKVAAIINGKLKTTTPTAPPPAVSRNPRALEIAQQLRDMQQ